MSSRFRVGARTDVGKVREGNEDGFMARDPLFAVADGMGGHRGGEVASKLALDTLKKAADRSQALPEVVKEANRVVYRKAAADRALAGMGTTLTAILADGEHLRLAHVGDSRAYLVRDGELQRITKDHTVVERMVEEGRITAEEAEIHPQRSILTRALGVEEEVQIDQATIEAHPGDRIVLCSDGLTGMIGEARILDLLDRHEDPQSASDALVDAANEAGGLDNVTVVVIDVVDGDGTGVAAPPAASRRRLPSFVLRVLVPLVLLIAALVSIKQLFIDNQWFVGESNGNVAVFRGIPARPLGLDLATLVEETQVPVASVVTIPAYRDVAEGITASSEEDARAIVAQMEADLAARAAVVPP
ncbi:MAG TPA: Stp1/IreP family PP2C-type Ser/Thr phosphatase [Actinomycetota bacterium]|nr:Stp1/IreP family PP2C-type Ser/Thr phosphatase [Actinomycetota bacterium]